MNKFQMDFNGTDFSDYLIVENVRRPFLPPTDFMTEKVMGKRGVKFFKREDSEFTIEVDIRIIKDKRRDVLELKQYLQPLLYSKEPGKLILRDNTAIFNYAILGYTDLDMLLRTGSATLEFICHDATNYSNRLFEHILNVGDTIIHYNGSYEASPIITITGASGNHLDVRSVTTGDYVRIDDNPTATDVYEIDLDKEKVRKNGTLIMKKVYFESDFFQLRAGENKIRLSSGKGVMTYRECGFDG